MEPYSKIVKDRLVFAIHEMSKKLGLFVKNPEKDFTRNRKFTFVTLINLMLVMGGNSIGNELLKFADCNINMATKAAFIQQRQKLSPYAFEYLLHEFTDSYKEIKKHRGYIVLAVDGSDLLIAHNPKDSQTYFHARADVKGFNMLHLNAMYDICNKLYVDALIQPGREVNEYSALNDMVDRSKISEKVIVTADRGYESYNVLAHIEQKGWNYVIRVKDKNSNGILSALSLPSSDEFDVKIERILTRKNTKEEKTFPERYRFLSQKASFDFMDENNNYPISFRVVRFKISENTYETVITNLEEADFSPEQLSQLYHMRWGIETSFRTLKYAISLNNFHSKKVEFIIQEIFARLIMYNFCSMITFQTVISQKSKRYIYEVNFTMAIAICKQFFQNDTAFSLMGVEAVIQKSKEPIRIGRSYPRHIRSQRFTNFLYRAA